MTTMNNISGLQGLIGKNPMQSNGLAQGKGGLAAFLGLLLSQTNNVNIGQQLQGLEGDAQKISEKIADILNLNPAETDKLTSLLTNVTGSDISASLTSDLTANLSLTLQGQGDETLSMSEIDELAAFLNDIQPGTANTGTEVASVAGVDMYAKAEADASYKDLIAKLSTLKTADEIMSFLAENGFLQKNIDHILNIALPIVQDPALSQTDIELALTNTIDDQAADLFSPSLLSENPESSSPLASLQSKTPTQKTATSPSSSSPSEEATGFARGPLSNGTSDTSDVSRYQQNKDNANGQKSDNDGLAQKLVATLSAATNNNASPPTNTRGFAQASASSAAFAQMFGQSSGDTGFSGGAQDFLNNGQAQRFTDAQGHTHITQTPVAQGFSHYMAPGIASNPRTTQMVAVQMHKNAQAKIDTFTMQLEPADLGRLDIKMTFKEDGSVKAHLVAERPETLSMLQKDAAHLQRLLQDAGLDTNNDSLSFDLQQSTGQDLYESNGGARKEKGASINNKSIMNDNENAMALQMAVQTHGYISQSGVNIMV